MHAIGDRVIERRVFAVAESIVKVILRPSESPYS